jgi:hypothetical protein
MSGEQGWEFRAARWPSDLDFCRYKAGAQAKQIRHSAPSSFSLPGWVIPKPDKRQFPSVHKPQQRWQNKYDIHQPQCRIASQSKQLRHFFQIIEVQQTTTFCSFLSPIPSVAFKIVSDFLLFYVDIRGRILRLYPNLVIRFPVPEQRKTIFWTPPPST